jgi:predicted DNA-binding transcriptional regulator AlpA
MKPAMPDLISPLLSVGETAVYLGMSKQWCYQRLKRILPPVKIGGRVQWLKEDLDRLIREKKMKPTPSIQEIRNKILLREALRGTRPR